MKTRFPAAEAARIAEMLRVDLVPYCHRVIVAGSLRRGRAEVGDIELVFIPRVEQCPRPGELFSDLEEVDVADSWLNTMVRSGTLAYRPNVKGSFTWGLENKLAIHVPSGIAVDLFATTEAAWFNYLVCRTGGAESNKRICMAAQAKGWKWNPYGAGFTSRDGLHHHRVSSEREVFDFVGLAYVDPKDRP